MCVGAGHRGSVWDVALCPALQQPGPWGPAPCVGLPWLLDLLAWALGVGTESRSPLGPWGTQWESLQGRGSSRELKGGTDGGGPAGALAVP